MHKMRNDEKTHNSTGAKVMRILAAVFMVAAIVAIVLGVRILLSEETPKFAGLSANYIVEKEMPVFDFEGAVSENQAEGDAVTPGNYGQYIFVGDSRFVGMSSVSKESNDVYIAEVGEGYYYLCQHLGEIQAEITTDTALIIGMGVNDLGNQEKYIRKINEMAGAFNCQVYFLTVNPVDESKTKAHGYNVTNEKIDEFNEAMMEQLLPNVRIIDSNSYLWSVGFESSDGIHYSGATSKEIYNFIKSNL
ncbi:MAG: hypothetical protein MJ105_00660 [Lachnospiraceae bacterium]|nr:hypothetical protein [Lachnospiraceae bacterium]